MRPEVAIATHDSTQETAANAAKEPSVGTQLARIVTTSWDDGDPLDLRIARMLADRQLAGTFYIPIKGHHWSCRLSRTEMLSLDSQGFEIGAHGVSHPNLPECDAYQLRVEVESSKKRMENDLGKHVLMFAYPRGRHSGKVIAAVRKAGFTGARTTAMLARELTFDPFRMPTSIQVFPHSNVGYIRNLTRAGDIARAWRYMTRFRRAANWVDLAKVMFDEVMANGGVWHLYGHSWEIEELRLWDALSVVLDYVADRPGVLHLPNSAVVRWREGESRGEAVCSQEPNL